MVVFRIVGEVIIIKSEIINLMKMVIRIEIQKVTEEDVIRTMMMMEIVIQEQKQLKQVNLYIKSFY